MKSLSDLQAVLGGMQGQITACVEYIDQLANVFGGKRRKSPARVNGATLREQVKRHYHQHRGIPLVAGPPNPDNVTIQQAAKMLKISEAGLRWRITNGILSATKEVRITGSKGVGRKPHTVMVVNRNDVLALQGTKHTPRTTITNRTVAKAVKKARAKPTPGHGAKIAAQRQRTVDYLQKFDVETPRSSDGWNGLGSLVRRGYLKKKGDGYVRTGKEYSPKLPSRS